MSLDCERVTRLRSLDPQRRLIRHAARASADYSRLVDEARRVIAAADERDERYKSLVFALMDRSRALEAVIHTAGLEEAVGTVQAAIDKQLAAKAAQPEENPGDA